MKQLAYSLLFFLAVGIITMESCTVDEPVTEVTYTADVKPIMDGNCIGCHSGNTPSASLDLTTYANVRAIAETDTLVMRMNDEVNPMPVTGLLPQADRTTVEDWVAGGFKQ
ncbi:MAG: hypothetical protein AB8G11_21660 [Saprospiraceae bacterium]